MQLQQLVTPTTGENPQEFAYTEDLREIVHADAVRIELDYAKPPIVASDHASSTIRVRTGLPDEKARCSGTVPGNGRRCFRWDSIGSVISILFGSDK